MSPYEAYQLFLALKQHFTTPTYDFFKYNGKVRTTVDSFMKRKDVYHFRKLAALPDPRTRIIACMLHDITWIKSVVSADGEKAQSDYQKTVESFSYAFKSFLAGFKQPLPDLLKISSSNPYPVIAQMVIDDEIPLQFVIVLDDLLGFLPQWKDQLEEILWDPYARRIEKLRPFFRYDRAKAREIFLAWADENR